MGLRGMALLIVMIAQVLSACFEAASDQEAGMVPGVSTSTRRDAAAQEPEGDKPLPPLEVALVFEPAEVRVGEAFTAVLTITPLVDAPRVVARLEATGIVSPLDEPTPRWHDLPAHSAVVVRARFCLTGPGEGEIRGIVDVADEAGQPLYGRTAVVSVLAVDDTVLTGISGPLLLRLEYLGRQLRAGAITQREYERARDQLLGGGATSAAASSPPAPSTRPCARP